jgi:hypothetical protein
MNQERKPHVDPESPETIERLDKLEQQLKATRPQSPQLDLASLQRIADDDALDTLVERAPDRKPIHALPGSKRSASGRVLAIASSWVCGAGVGALVMFVLMSRTETTPDPGDRVVHVRQETPESIAEESIVDSSSEQHNADRQENVLSPVKPFDVNGSILTMGRDPLRQWGAAYLSDGPTLQVGMYLGRHSERHADRTHEKRREYSGQPTGSTSTLEFESPVSRRELMQEFLGESTGAAL